MKHLLTLLLMATTYTGFAQITPATPLAGTKQTNTNQAYIWRNGGGDTTRLYLRLGAPGITAQYYEIGSGGGSLMIDTNRLMYLDKNQTSTAYKAFTGRLAASNSGNLTGAAIEATSTNSGLYGLEVNNTGGGAAFKTTTTGGISSENINVSASIPSLKAYNLSTGAHAQFGSTTGKIATVENSGNIITPKASASNHVVIKSQLDSLGAIIGGGGTVTSVAAGYGMDFTTITTSGSVAVDTSVIVSREYLDLRGARIIKDFYADSTLAGTTSEGLIYADTIPANTLFKNGDKITFMVAGLFETITSSSNNTFTIKLGGIHIFSSEATAITAGSRSFNIECSLMKASTDLVKVTTKFVFELQSDESVINNVIVNQFYQGTFTLTGANELAFYGQLDSATTSSIKAKMGYIEFKPATL